MRLQDYYPTLASEGINGPASFQKIDSKKIYIADFRAFRGLEYPRMVVVLDQNLVGLE